MPFFTLAIEDYSPFISYTSDWIPGSSGDDNSTMSYSQSTFMVTHKAGGTAKIAFNGTGITIFGAKRTNHGRYQVNIDGTNTPAASGSATPWQFQVPLFDIHGLQQGPHTVSITNQEEGQYLDVDYVTIEGDVGEDSKGELYVVNYQDSDPNISYLPTSSQWSTNPPNLGTFFGSSGHITSSTSAAFNFTFNVSDGVSLYGPMSTNGANYRVSLDGSPPTTYQSRIDRYLPQTLLYHATNIGTGEHHLHVDYEPTGDGQVFAIDYANVYTTNSTNSGASVSGAGSSPAPNPSGDFSSTKNGTSPPQDSSGLSAGAAAGIAIGACLVVLLVAGLIFLLVRRRRERQLNEKAIPPNTVDPYPTPTSGLREYYQHLPNQRPPVLHIQTNFDRFPAPSTDSPYSDPRRLTLPLNLNKSAFSSLVDQSRHTWDPRLSTGTTGSPNLSPAQFNSPVLRNPRAVMSTIVERDLRPVVSPPDYSQTY